MFAVRLWPSARPRSRRPRPQHERLALPRAEARLSLRVLGFQRAFVLADERPDLVRHVQQLQPLLLIEGDREPAHAVDRDAALLGYLQRHAAGVLPFQPLVLRAEPLHFRLQIVITHGQYLTAPP